MQLDKIIITVSGFVAIACTYWFFLLKKDTAVNVEEDIDIIVDGGYNPNTILLSRGKTTRITFTRRDSSSCLEEVILPDFKIRKFLPMNKPVTIRITPQNTGTFEIVCGMNMFHGKILVKEPMQKEV